MQPRTSTLLAPAVTLGMDRKHLQYLFLEVIDKFNLFDALLSYRNGNNATEGWCRVALATKHSKSRHET